MIRKIENIRPVDENDAADLISTINISTFGCTDKIYFTRSASLSIEQFRPPFYISYKSGEIDLQFMI